MKHGKNYLVGLNGQATIEPKEGGWAQVRYARTGKTVAVSPVVTTKLAWRGQTYVHIFALHDGPDPTPGHDELTYRDEHGTGESKIIESFKEL